MSGAARQELALGKILDNFVDAQRRDIGAYCSGHLNESRLYHPLEQAPYSKWFTANNATLPQIVGKSQSVEKISKKIEKMRDSLVTFSLGTPALPFPRSQSRVSECLEASPRYHVEPRSTSTQPTSFINSSPLPSSRRLKSATARARKGNQKSSSSAPLSIHFLQEKSFPGASLPEKSFLLDDIQAASHCRGRRTPDLLQTHLTAVTKKDKYKEMKEFEAQLLRNSSSFRHHGLMGSQAVEHLEKRVKQKLKEFDASVNSSDASNLSRLEIYADVFEELIESSPTFSYLLRQIKSSYQAYLTSLLESRAIDHSSLEPNFARLSIDSSDATAAELEKEITKVSHLEQRAKELLEYNESLRKELSVQLQLSSLPAHQDDLQASSYVAQRAKPSQRVEQLRYDIMQKMEAISELRTKLRTEYVPSSVCTYLQQCLKDTQVEIQKVISQKEYFERRIVELDRDLHEAVESADTTDRDAKRIWKRIQAIKTDDVRVAHESDEDESSKWCWYIS